MNYENLKFIAPVCLNKSNVCYVMNKIVHEPKL